MNALEKFKMKRTFPPPRTRKYLRQCAGLTQLDIALELGVDRAAVSRYENGEREPRGEVLVKYAKLLEELADQMGKGDVA